MKRSTILWAWLLVAMVCTVNTSRAQFPTSGMVLRLTGEAGVEEAIGDPAENLDPVVRWLDQSGAGNHVSTNGNVDTQTPTYLTGVVNGRSVVNYDNPNDRLEATTPLLTGATDFSIFAVIRGGAGERVIGANFGIGNLSGLEFYKNSLGQLSLYNAGYLIGATTMANSTWYLVQAEKSGSIYTLRVNDMTDATGTLAGSIGSAENWTVGNAPDYQAGTFGDMAQEIVYNRALTAEERSFVVGRLADDYNLNVVPEPSTVALLGLCGLLLLRRRSR